MPEASCAGREELERALSRPWAAEARALEARLAPRIARRLRWRKRWSRSGRCEACQETTTLRVDRGAPMQRNQGQWMPVWRESLQCAVCGLNCRQRYVAGRLREQVAPSRRPRVYLTERLTPFYDWAQRTLGEALDLVGSEYLPDERARGQVPAGVRHEDVQALSFDDASLDLIVSGEVLEHVPHPDAALAEFARCLGPGGTLLLTVPFDVRRAESRARARLVEGRVEHLLDPVHHGNPVPQSEGSLVFTDFGWDLLERARAAGFAEIEARLYWSRERAYLGGPHLLFVARG